MIDPPRDIPAGAAVDVIALADVENIDAAVTPTGEPRPASFLPTPRLGFADPFANVFNHLFARWNQATGVDAAPVDRRGRQSNPVRPGGTFGLR